MHVIPSVCITHKLLTRKTSLSITKRQGGNASLLHVPKYTFSVTQQLQKFKCSMHVIPSICIAHNRLRRKISLSITNWQGGNASNLHVPKYTFSLNVLFYKFKSSMRVIPSIYIAHKGLRRKFHFLSKSGKVAMLQICMYRSTLFLYLCNFRSLNVLCVFSLLDALPITD